MKNIFLKFIYFVLANYSRKVIRNHNPFVIAITGSLGKSSTKEAVNQVLVDHFGTQEVRTNYGNLNAEIGIPLTILGYKSLPNKFLWLPFLVGAWFRSFVKKYPKYLIIEMGVEHPGDLKYFSTIVQPDIGIITAISSVHSINFGGGDGLLKEKLAMAEIVKDKGLLIVNGDFEKLTSAKRIEGFLSVGIYNPKVNFKAENIKLTLEGTEYRIITTGQKISVKSQLVGRQFIYAQLFAFALGQYFNIQSLKIKESLERITPINGRMKLIKGDNNIIILDDTYNADPLSVKAALDVLSEVSYAGRKVAILGNMNELGEQEVSAHKEIASYAKDRVDLALFVGKNGKIMQDEFGQTEKSFAFSSRKEAIKSLPEILKKRDLVLVKASQNGNYFEEIVKFLLKDKSLAKNLLVRQSDYWLRKK